MAIGSTSLLLAPIGAVTPVTTGSTRWPARPGQVSKRSTGSNPSLPSLLSFTRAAVASCAACLLTAFAPPAAAGLLTTDFAAGPPINKSTASGSAAVDDGILKLTRAAGSENGYFYVDDLDRGIAVNHLTVSFRLLIGGGAHAPGDGFSFSFGSDLPASPGFAGEEGAGSGLRIAFDTFDDDSNGNSDAVAIDVLFNGVLKGRRDFQSSQGADGSKFYDVTIDLSADGKLDLFYGLYQPNVSAPVPVFAGIQTEYTPSGGWNFAFAAQTGTLNDVHWIDDLTIATKVPEPGTLVLLGLAFACAAAARRRRQ